MTDAWPEKAPPTVKSIVREWLETYNRWLVGSKQEEQLVRMLERINKC